MTFEAATFLTHVYIQHSPGPAYNQFGYSEHPAITSKISKSLNAMLKSSVTTSTHLLQECIPVGCVPPARRPYLPGPAGGGGGTWSRRGAPGPGGCTWSRGAYLVWGVYLVRGGVPGPGGVYLVWWAVPGPGGECTWSGGVYLVRYSPPVNRMTDACKNITLPQLRCGR